MEVDIRMLRVLETLVSLTSCQIWAAIIVVNDRMIAVNINTPRETTLNSRYSVIVPHPVCLHR